MSIVNEFSEIIINSQSRRRTYHLTVEALDISTVDACFTIKHVHLCLSYCSWSTLDKINKNDFELKFSSIKKTSKESVEMSLFFIYFYFKYIRVQKNIDKSDKTY